MLAYDLYCGPDFGGWAKGLISEGWTVIGFDISGAQGFGPGYPGELRVRDVLAIHGSELKDADLIVGSPPCQEPSYRAMPWSRAQKLNRQGPPHRFIALFEACLRIRLQASIAAGRYIPLVIENVRGAQRWIGVAKNHYGSYYLWGDVPETLPATDRVKIVRGHINKRDGHTHTRHLTNRAEHIKQHGSGRIWFDTGIAALSSGGLRRKAASAAIAEIPFPLAQHIARYFAFGEPVNEQTDVRQVPIPSGHAQRDEA